MEHAAELSFALQHAWLIPAIPLASFALVGMVIRPLSARLAGLVATLAILASAALAGVLAWDYLRLSSLAGHSPTLIPWSIEWLRYQEHLAVRLGILVDPISVLLMVVVTTVSFLVHLYSIGYMHGERSYGRYFTYLNLFTFSMLGLVTAPNIIQMFVFWELVGASSFLLIGYYYDRPSAVAAAKKAFTVTRFADLGFLIGVLLLAYHGGKAFGVLGPVVGPGGAPFDFAFLTNATVLQHFATLHAGATGLSLLTVAMILIFIGAAGKSAMFPLHIWLPDAMEGPTPVSALIHAATMVVAGVYLVARMFPVFAVAHGALMVVTVVGAFTSLFAAVIGCTQDDIKRVLAFSTLSQLGYMMFALGIATPEDPAGYTASMFHLFTHAFFKALLFLGSGAVIHAVHNNEIWKMGGLRRKMPITHATFLIATLSIAGIWPFAGFFSKDEILSAALGGGHPVVFAVGLLGAGLTAFYMMRIYVVTFWGQPRSGAAGHAHEVSAIMWIPMVTLATLSIASGFVPFGRYVHLGAAHEAAEAINWAVAIPGTAAGLAGLALSLLLYAGPERRLNAAVALLGRLYPVIKHKFYFDEIYLFVTHRIIFRHAAAPIARFDRKVVDGGVNMGGSVARTSGALLNRLQTGQVQMHGMGLISGVIFILVAVWAYLIW
jgi:NADH-quinone oxidoreductase subunit L